MAMLPIPDPWQLTGGDVLQVMAISAGITILIGALFAALVNPSYFRRRERLTEDSRETAQQRIQRLTASLAESIQTIEEIEREMQEGHAALEKLRQQSERYERLKNLNEAEAQAVAELVGAELKEEGRRSFWRDLGLFVLGAFVSIVMPYLVNSS